MNLEGLKDIVRADSKQRYDLILENSDGVKLDSILTLPVVKPALEVGMSASVGVTPTGSDKETWWIKARQGHSIKARIADVGNISWD